MHTHQAFEDYLLFCILRALAHTPSVLKTVSDLDTALVVVSRLQQVEPIYHQHQILIELQSQSRQRAGLRLQRQQRLPLSKNKLTSF